MKPLDVAYISKYKRAGWSNHMIASKLGITEEEVEIVWRCLQSAEKELAASGYKDLLELVNLTAEQFKGLGLMLRTIVESIGDRMDPVELSSLITDDKSQTLKNLMEKAIVLKPFDRKRLESLQEKMLFNPEQN
jgi:hypothetical protein